MADKAFTEIFKRHSRNAGMTIDDMVSSCPSASCATFEDFWKFPAGQAWVRDIEGCNADDSMAERGRFEGVAEIRNFGLEAP